MEKNLEIWADSFHEGIWCIENIQKFFEKNNYTIDLKYLNGFIPNYTFKDNEHIINFTIYGSYKSWENIPTEITDLIEWGKPDFIIFDPNVNKIILAVEETAATPTGNQATQRCERQYR